MKKLLLGLLLLLQLGFAHAGIYWRAYSANGATPLEACKVGWSDKANVGAYRVDDTKWMCTYKGTSYEYAYRYGSCDVGTVYNTLTGVCDKDCSAGQVSTQTYKEGSGSATSSLPTTVQPNPTSDGQCAVTVSKVVRCFSVVNATGGKDYYCTYEVTTTGEPAAQGAPAPSAPTSGTQTPTTSPPKPSNAPNCPPGTVQIGIDSAGTPICAGKGTDPLTKPVPPTTTTTSAPTTNPDGSTTQTETRTRTNADGSTTTTTTTTKTNPDGSKTTTTSESTSNDAGGGSGEADEGDKNDLCKLHPELNICKNSTIRGACAEVSCEGDAIQCAIAREVAKRNCEQRDAEKAIKDSAQYDLGNKVLTGADPMASQLPSKSNATPWAMPTSYDNAGWLGAGSCFQDKSFTLQGQTITIPFSRVCDYLIVFRYVVMIIAAIVCFKLLSGVILRD